MSLHPSRGDGECESGPVWDSEEKPPEGRRRPHCDFLAWSEREGAECGRL